MDKEYLYSIKNSFTCEICYKRYAKIQSLKVHKKEKNHNNEKIPQSKNIKKKSGRKVILNPYFLIFFELYSNF